jgi:hypothetical protein
MSTEGWGIMLPDTRSFDTDLQMFRDPSPAVNLARLHFQRWLIDHGRSEHAPAGPPSGELADAPMTHGRGPEAPT